MSGEANQSSGGSRHTNLNNSVTPAEPGSSGESDRELPTPEERVSEFHDQYPDRANLQLTERHGQPIRREYTHERWEEWESESIDETDDQVSGSSLVERRAYSWIEAVEKTLESHEETRRTTVNLEKGRPSDPEYAEFSIDAETRWFADYQRRYYAQMKAWLRELCGGERPSGGITKAHFDDPYIALVTLSASSVPDGERIGPIDHTRRRRESWSGVYHTLRNRMRSLGFDIGDGWQYDRRAEPHTGERGGGLNHCYGHDHIVIVVDGEVSAGDFRPIVEKHVEECDWAGRQAHDLDIQDWRRDDDIVETVEVKAADEVENLAAYVASYCGIQPVDLLERSIEYVAWASAVTAANVKTVSRSDAASHAATADSCKQRSESSKAEQSSNHGETVVPSDKRGYEYECGECGSPHGIEQDQQPPTAAEPLNDSAVADGGIDREGDLRDRWPSARAAASVGESPQRTRWRKQIEEYLERNPDAAATKILGELHLPPSAREVLNEIDAEIDRSDPAGFERVPEWHVKSVTIGESEYPASAGNGIDLVETVDPVECLLQETRLGNDGAYSTYWRCEKTGVAMYGGRRLAGYLVNIGIKCPEVASKIITAERGPLSTA